MEIYEEIRRLEEGIATNQKLLSNIMYRYNQAESKDEITAIQISNCRENIETLKRQLNALERGMNVQKPANLPSNTNVVKTEVQSAPRVPYDYSAGSNANKAAKKTKPKKSFEESFGASGMGILASILIFISFVLFSALLYPVLTDSIKLISMIGVSGIFTGIGLFKLHKLDKHPLWLSVTGCGVGGLYIALFMGDIYFNILNDIVLYVCLLLWCIGVCYLSRKKSLLFEVIGYIGITVSVYLGVVLGSPNMTVFLYVYTIVALLIFGISHFKRDDFNKNWPFAIAWVVNMLPLLISSDDGIWAGTFILIPAICFVLFYALLKVKPSNNNVVQTITIICNTFYLFIMMLNTMNPYFDSNLPSQIASLILFMVIQVLIERLDWNSNSIGRCIMISIISFCYIVFFGMWEWPIFVIALIYFVYNRLSGSKIYKWFAVSAALIGCFQTSLIYGVYIALALLVIIVSFALEYTSKEKFSNVYAAFLYLINSIILFASIMVSQDKFSFKDDVTICLVCGIIGIINALVNNTQLLANPVTHKKGTLLVVFAVIINKILMITVLIEMFLVENIVLALIATVIFSITTSKLLSKDNFWAAMYVGFKYTMLVIALAHMADIKGLWISIIFFVLAIISIILGFVIKRKGLRMYGLILSLISVVKLVLFDIDYDNSIMRAASFFVCGILCFVISFIYNLVDKRLKAANLPVVEENENTNS